MFKDHKMFIIFDLNQIAGIINNHDYLMVAAITNDYPNHPNIYNAGILMPSTELLMQWADGVPYILESQYPAYLNTKDPSEMIAALLAALTKKDIYLYIPYNEFQIYGNILMQHLYYWWGITCGDMERVPFYFNEMKLPYVLSMFYMVDVLEPQVYLDIYPSNYALPDFVIMKLANDLYPFNTPASFQDYSAYFNDLNKRCNKRAPVNMVTVVEGIK